MRSLLACALVVCAASPASAQEDDVAARMVREQETARRSQVDRALGAPAKAFDRFEGAAHGAPAAAVATAPATKPSSKTGFPWKTAAVVAGVLAAAVALLVSRSRAGAARRVAASPRRPSIPWRT